MRPTNDSPKDKKSEKKISAAYDEDLDEVQTRLLAFNTRL